MSFSLSLRWKPVKISELIVLAVFLIGLVMATLGAVLYIQKLMIAYSVDWTLQLVVFGLYMIILALVLAKIFQKVIEW